MREEGEVSGNEGGRMTKRENLDEKGKVKPSISSPFKSAKSFRNSESLFDLQV